MKARDLLTAIDEEVDLKLRREGSLDIEKLVNSYPMNEQWKPVVRGYAENVCRFHEEMETHLKRNAKTIAEGCAFLGWVASFVVGGAAGAVVGYAIGEPGGANDLAVKGALLGFFIELFFKPAGVFFVKQYARHEARRRAADYQTHRGLALSKLEGLPS